MIELSAAAREKLLEFMDAAGYTPDVVGVRVQVVPGGCAGFNYGLDLEPNPQEDDHVIEHGEITVYVDPFSAQYLEGTMIDWNEDMMGSGFKFENPNAVGACGCGTSFGV